MSSAAQNTDNDENARYKRAIRTAEELFKKVGFRAVTMELVAREANVAKPPSIATSRTRMNSSWPCAHAWHACCAARWNRH